MPLFSIEFHTPEEFFLSQKVAAFEWRSIDPLEVLKKHKANDQPTEYHKKVSHSSQQTEFQSSFLYLTKFAFL